MNLAMALPFSSSESYKLLMSVGITVGICILSIIQFNQSFGLQYINYSSEKYQIQFQYPIDWQLKEKMSRFDEGTDIQINSPTISGGYILVQYANKSAFQGLDFRASVYDLFKSSITGDYSKDYKVIEQPSFITLDNQQAGTYLFTSKDKYEDYALKWAEQRWLVRTPDHGYLMAFASTSDIFDDPAITEVRDHFIKSIKFMGVSNSTVNNVPSRFD